MYCCQVRKSALGTVRIEDSGLVVKKKVLKKCYIQLSKTVG